MRHTKTCLLALALVAFFSGVSFSVENAKSEGDYMLVTAFERSATATKEISLNLSAVLDRNYGTPVKGLTLEDITITEDGKPVKALDLKPINSVSSKTDIVIAIDTTSSMSEEINGVKNSILSFTDTLTKSKMSVRVGGVAFGDKVRDVFDLGSDVSYHEYISNKTALDGADSPENPLDAIAKVMREFSFRPEAQKIIVLITDDRMHQRGDSASGADPGSVFGSKTDEVSETATGRFTIHTVDAYNCETAECPRALSRATGGVAIDLPRDGNVDLSTLPIKDFVLSGYMVTFKTSDDKKRRHDIKLRVNGLGSKYGELTQTVYY